MVPSTTTTGCFIVSGSVSSSASYKSDELVLTIASATSIPPVPEIIFCTFSSDARELMIIFTSATDYAGFDPQLSFQCSRVFQFTGAVYSTCHWITSSQVNAVLGVPYDSGFTAAVPLKVPQYLIQLYPGVLRAACSQALSKCASYPTASSFSPIIIKPPNRVIYPTVSLSFPSTFPACLKTVCFDASNSNGNFGRSWLSVEWSVDVNQSYYNVVGESSIVRINKALKLATTFTTDNPLCLSSALFDIQVPYIISLTVTNFLGSSGTHSKIFSLSNSSTEANVQILSPFLSTMTRNRGLLVAASATLSSCVTATNVNTFYEWRMYYDDLEFQVEVISTSLNYATFQLDPFTLLPDSKYTLELRVIFVYKYRDQLKKVMASDFIVINVLASGVSAIIFGPQIRSIGLNDSIYLDASESHSIDNPYKDALFYQW